MLHWRLLMAAIILALAMGLTVPLSGLTSGLVWAGDPDDPAPPEPVLEDPDDP